ncbi:cytochrome d ubiquinol oxidase subunit II [Kitasatospora sp. RB6PN24]|uniref:cytochrome d ubiquinol oxidase subunit II n=1 Tax=Kitasatospora humi TaxID=2893891 RepID=UPI001E59E0BD|nr:cytochrome d ubiquinol oxidase subunit II [Kitasatospora humi]MCC9306011.1 cytochrome d ubiquinol oxidase subunit II [Kitasatospora humi]
MAEAVAWIMLVVLAAYACAGGTDYGAGFWDLCAGGAERGERPRRLIDHAMEPVWEANNVWLIFLMIIMWTGFPPFFAAVFSAMWLPLALAVLGLVLRGGGFALRKPTRRLAQRRVYGAAFAVSSLLTPFFLGAVIGGIASGRVAPGVTASADAWSNPTSIITGLMTIGATAYLGAVFLTADAHRYQAPDLVDYFRLRAWCSLAALVVLALIGLPITHHDARFLWSRITTGAPLGLVIAGAVVALVTALLLARRALRWCRYTAVASVVLVIAAWGVAQRPYLLPTSLTVSQAAGAHHTLVWLVIVTGIAVVLVGPSLAVLYWLDTRGKLEALADSDTEQEVPPAEPA